MVRVRPSPHLVPHSPGLRGSRPSLRPAIAPSYRSSNPFVLIYLRTLCTTRPLKISRNPSLFNRFRTLAETMGGYTCLHSSHCKFFPTHRTNLSPVLSGAPPSEPLHLALHGETISASVSISARETFPLSPVSNSRERTTGSTARLIQQLARDRRPGPLAIRRRNPVPPFSQKGRPGKASSVRLGSIVGP